MKEHPVFPKLRNEHAKIWRFMDFTKFVNLLDTKSLFFSRSDKLGDLFEGSIPRANIAQRSSWYKDTIPDKNIRELSKFREKLRFHTFLNCWHINEIESDAMWKIYTKNNTGIAIQSTYTHLIDVLKEYEDVYIGPVNYIDYDSEFIPEGNMFWPFIHKQNSFKHETELRAIIQNIPNHKEGTSINVPGPLGVNKIIDLDLLIEKIYISPSSPEWFNKLVQSIIQKYTLDKSISFSKLSDRPVF